MSGVKRPMISLFKIIFVAILGVLCIFVQPNYAASSDQATSSERIVLDPNTAYKVDRTVDKTEEYWKETENPVCDGQTAQVQFTFYGEDFQGGVFVETYPIQDNWDLHFNTPNTKKPLYFQDLTGCNLHPRKASLELLSGYKDKDEAEDLKDNAHFVVAKDYYAFPPDGGDGEPQPLGSLTAIGGTEFPALRGSAIGQLIIKPDSIRAPHWHLKYTETGYCYKGLGQVGIIMPGNTLPVGSVEEGFFGESRVEEFFVREGEIFHFPEASQHYLRNVGKEDFECVLFFAEGQALTEDKLLTITLQNIVGGTPLGVLGPVLVTDKKDVTNPDTAPMYKSLTAKKLSEAPEQTYTSRHQNPDIYPVVEACSGTDPDSSNPGCFPPDDDDDMDTEGKRRRSIYSTLKP